MRTFLFIKVYQFVTEEGMTTLEDQHFAVSNGSSIDYHCFLSVDVYIFYLTPGLFHR